jgi:hypothetical protein
MRRFLFVLAMPAGAAATAAALLIAACSSTSASERPPFEPEDAARREGGPVEPPDAGVYDAGPPVGPEPSCAKYCELVTKSCDGVHAQYASKTECLELCARLPPGDAGDKGSNTVACRQYYAGSPSKTDALTYCVAAGPFGGSVCGDRCPVFCGLAVGACSPDAAAAPYPSYPDCQTSCLEYPYKDAGADGGGEPPDGPRTGDTLNCRLFHTRSAVKDGSGCVNVGPDSGACR